MNSPENYKGVFDENSEEEGHSATIGTRLLLAFVSLFFPGLGQTLQYRYMKAFDFLLFNGAALLLSTIFIIQLNLGVWTPFLMLVVLAVPYIWSAINAFVYKRSPGGADAVVRNIFLYIFLFLVIIGPYHLINLNFGFKVYPIPADYDCMKPTIYPGDVVIIDRDAYDLRPLGTEIKRDSVRVGDIVYHEPIPETDVFFKLHWVLAAPGDTLIAVNGNITVNGEPFKLPIETPYEGPSDFGPIIVPRSQVFLVDNCWQLSPLYLKDIGGRVSGVLFSKEPQGKWRTKRFGSAIRRLYKPPEKIERGPETPRDSLQSTDSLHDSVFSDTSSAK